MSGLLRSIKRYKFNKIVIQIGCAIITHLDTHPSLEEQMNRRLLLQYLDLTDCTAITDNGLKIIVKNCPQLIFVYLRRCIQITGIYIGLIL